MAGNKLTFVTLLGLCAGAYGQERSELSDLEFFPHPINAVEAVRVDAEMRPPAAPSGSSPSAAGRGDAAIVPPGITEAIVRRLDAIRDEIAANGPRSRALVDEYVHLGTLYAEVEDHLAAIQAFESAVDVIRVNDGLYALDQVAVLEEIIESKQALEDYAAAAEHEQQVISLAYRNLQDPMAPTILRARADREMEAVRRFMAGQTPPPVDTSGSGGMGLRIVVLSPLQAARRSLWMARVYYDQALRAAIQQRHSLPELLELEELVAQTYLLEASPRYREGGLAYRSAEAFFQTQLSNAIEFRQDPIAVAEALLRLGDWRLIASNNAAALNTYRMARDVLTSHYVDPETIARMLSPDVPQALPALETNAGGNGERKYRGYVDVSFVVSRYGRSRQFEVLDSSPGTSRAIERRLRNYIYQNRFRPRFEGEELAQADAVSVRYYYDH